MVRVPERGFTKPEEFAAWLSSLPKEQSVSFHRVISARDALRVLPNTGLVFSTSRQKAKWRINLAFAGFRADAISRIACTHPMREIDVELWYAARDAGRSAVDAAIFRAVSASRSAAVTAARSAVSAAHSAAGYAISVIDAAQNGARSAAVIAADSAAYIAAYSAVWEAVTADARALESGMSIGQLANAPLWPSDSTYKLVFDRTTFLSVVPSFEVWVDWHDAIAAGRAPWGLPREISDKLEMRIALGDRRGENGKDFWERDPDVVNSEIARWVAAAQAKVAE